MNSRVIKFRVWTDGKMEFPGYGDLKEIYFDADPWVDAYSGILMQWSGLTLPSGVDIYEGDILNTKAARWEVVFERGSFVAKWLMGVGDQEMRQTLWPMMGYAILLGNRWENPELLLDIVNQLKENVRS